jgi:hypothetical protein
METNSVPIIVSVGFMIAVIIVVIVVSQIRAQKRTEALTVFAQEIGFAFEGDSWNHQPKAHQIGTPLFGRGSSRRFNNIMTGTASGFKTSLFDYSYMISGGKSSTTYTQTVAAFSQDLWLPIFELRPEGFFDRIGEAFVSRDIDFESFPDFSKRYFLRGPAEETIRALFSPALISFLEGLPAEEKWHIEGLDTTLVIYRSNVTVRADELQTFLDKTSSMAKAFFSSPTGLSKPVR